MSETNANPPGESPVEKPPPQFSLGALMLFVFLCAVYFSQVQVFVVRESHTANVSALATIWGGWFIFGVFYVRKRLWGVLVVHCFVQAITLAINLFDLTVALLIQFNRAFGSP